MEKNFQAQENQNKATGIIDSARLSASEMQEANATGKGENEQGQASFITGATTGGGSNFGQGSSHLAGDSYRQGNTVNAGSNYNNESDRLGQSSAGTSNEGSSLANVGATSPDMTDTADAHRQDNCDTTKRETESKNFIPGNES